MQKTSSYHDSFSFKANPKQYIYGGTKDDRLKRVVYDLPMELCKVISDLKNDKVATEEIGIYKFSPRKELAVLEKEIESNDTIKSIKIKSLYDYGRSAYVFETSRGDILKITRGDHFNGRSPQPFDFPIKDSGKITPKGCHYYYIEEKASENCINTEECLSVIESIKDHGFLPVDGLNPKNIQTRQFGRASDGRIYLLDPECAEPDTSVWIPKNKFLRFAFQIDSSIPPKALKLRNLFL